MNWIVISGVKPYDGRYEFDVARDFNTREWGWIKRLSGYMPLTVDQGFDGGDPELFCAFAVICLHRAGVVTAADVPAAFERVVDAPFGSAVTVEADTADDEEDDAGPPPPSSSVNGLTSGDGSTTSSETSDNPPNGSGTSGSGISAWPPVTSES